MPRTYFICPLCPPLGTLGAWLFSWTFVDRLPNADPGLVIAAHMEAAHPEVVYGPLIPASVIGKILGQRASQLSARL